MPAYRVDLLIALGGPPVTPAQLDAFVARTDPPAELWAAADGQSALVHLHVGAANAVSAATVAGAVCLTAAGRSGLAVNTITEVTVRRDAGSAQQVIRALLRREDQPGVAPEPPGA